MECFDEVAWKDDDATKYRALKKLLGLPLVESIAIDSLSVEEDSTATANVTVVPDGIDVSKLEWWSEDESVATADSGTVTGIAVGTTTIWAGKDGIKASCSVTVAESSVEYSVTATLEHCVSDNDATSVKKGHSFSCTITPDEGYKLRTVTCTMGSIAQTVADGKISISSVTGDIVISVTCEALAVYTVTNNLTQCTTSNSATQVYEGSSYSATLTPNDGHVLKSLVVTMGGEEQTVSGNTVTIVSVTGDIVVTAVAEETVAYQVVNCLTGCTNANSAVVLDEGASYSTHLVPDSGYILSGISAVMGDSPIEAAAGYVLSVESVSADVEISAEAKQGYVQTLTSDFDAGSSSFLFDENLICLSAGDYVEVQVQLSSSSSSSAQNILGVGNDISDWIADPCAKYLFYYYQSSNQLEIDMMTSGATASNMYWSRVVLALPSNSTLNIKVTREGIFVNDEFLNPDTCSYSSGGHCDSSSYKQAISEILAQSTVQIGACQGDVMSSLKYDFIQVVRRDELKTVAVSTVLTDCAYSGQNMAVLGTTFSAQLTPKLTYKLMSASVTMGGEEVEGAVDLATGKVSVSEVTGDIAVTAAAEQMEYVTVTADMYYPAAGWITTVSGLDFPGGDVIEAQVNLSATDVDTYEGLFGIGTNLSSDYNKFEGVRASWYTTGNSVLSDSSSPSGSFCRLAHHVDLLEQPNQYGGAVNITSYNVPDCTARFFYSKDGPWIDAGEGPCCISAASQYNDGVNDPAHAISAMNSCSELLVGNVTLVDTGIYIDHVRVYKAAGVQEAGA
jgi:hypothetical protein